ncbi:MAG: sigma-70 family RNA polymerase sigma factor, partial [Planctomycetota bacterium]
MDFGLPSERGWRRELEHELPWMQVLQETWLAALTRPPGDQGRPRAWLRTVMANLARQRGRRAWVRRRVTFDESEPLDPAPSPGHDQEQEELEALLLSELATLDEPFRSTLRQHFLGGLQLVQIARRDGVPEGTVRWRLKAGIERLRMRLDGRYGDRGRWLAALLPVAGPRRLPPVAPGTPLALVAGAGVGLLLLLGGAAWFFLGGEAGSAAPSSALVAVRESAPPAPRPAATLPTVEEPAPTASAPEPAVFADEFTLDVTVLDAEGAVVANADVLVHTDAGFEPRARTDPAGR